MQSLDIGTCLVLMYSPPVFEHHQTHPKESMVFLKITHTIKNVSSRLELLRSGCPSEVLGVYNSLIP